MRSASSVAENARAHRGVHHVVEGATPVGLAEQGHFQKRSVVGQGHAGVQHEVAVLDLVQAAPIQEKAHVALQALAAGERGAQLLDDSGLVLGEAVGVVPVDGGEGCVQQLVLDAVHDDRSALTVDQVQKVAIVQAERGVLGDKCRLHLELDNGHGLLDLLGEARLGLGKPGLPFRAKAAQGSFA